MAKKSIRGWIRLRYDDNDWLEIINQLVGRREEINIVKVPNSHDLIIQSLTASIKQIL